MRFGDQTRVIDGEDINALPYLGGGIPNLVTCLFPTDWTLFSFWHLRLLSFQDRRIILSEKSMLISIEIHHEGEPRLGKSRSLTSYKSSLTLTFNLVIRKSIMNQHKSAPRSQCKLRGRFSQDTG